MESQMKFNEISGTIIDSETWSQTHVRGSSSGFAYKGIGVGGGRTTSTVSNVAQLWVQTDDGREIAVRTNPDKFAVRGGHRVSMLLMPKRSGPAWMVAGFNHATGEKRVESGIPLIIMAIIALIFLSWIPMMVFALNVVAGLIAVGLFLWMLAYQIVCGVQIGRRGGAFIRKASAETNRPPAVDQFALETA